jgi:hypothetical protein
MKVVVFVFGFPDGTFACYTPLLVEMGLKPSIVC